MEAKQKIGLEYQLLLYKALRLSLEKLNRKGLTSDQQEFLETFLAVAFFRIPEFRTKLLGCLHKERDVNPEEWNFSLDKGENKGTTMYSVFDWDQEFYAGLPNVDFYMYFL